MKRKYANRPDWSRILDKQYKQIYVNDSSYRGYVTYLHLQKVRDPLYVIYDSDEVCIVDDDYVWMMQFPEGTDYSVTTTFDHTGRIIQWYFDVILDQGLTDEGVPFIDDLYIDLVYLPDGRTFILDEEELKEARAMGLIAQPQYDRALETVDTLIKSIRTRTNHEINETMKHFNMMNWK